MKSWCDLYEWSIRNSPESNWAYHFTRYLEIAETKMVQEKYLREGKLTRFVGICFNNENLYTYVEAKRILGLLIDESKKDTKFVKKMRIDPTVPGRPAITGRGSSMVWDFLSLKGSEGFTKCPHLTIAIGAERVHASGNYFRTTAMSI
jgi:hypothetical protein